VAELADAEGEAIWRSCGERIDVRFPSPQTDGDWELVAQGWVGYLPVTPTLALSLVPKVPIENLFRMLEYAYRLESFELLDGAMGSDSLADLYERLASILANRVLDRARRGLYASYQAEAGPLSYLRGSIDMADRMRRPWDTRLTCRYEEHTADLEENRILAWTLGRIAQAGFCSERTLPSVRRAFHTLHSVAEPAPFGPEACVGRLYNRLNDDYEPLHGLCRFFLEHSGPTHQLGDRRMIPFLVKMDRLYELFVAQWLKQHLPEQYRLEDQEHVAIGEGGMFTFNVDAVLYDQHGQALAVLDAKYKAPEKASNDDVYQVVTYAETVGCHQGALVYPAALSRPLDETFGRNRVRSLVFRLDGDLEAAGRAFWGEWRAGLCQTAAECRTAGSLPDVVNSSRRSGP
jgi:5-methylcytosine-specific restriction enzyme subunit McrC